MRKALLALIVGLLAFVPTQAQTPTQTQDALTIMKNQLAVMQPFYNALYPATPMGEHWMRAYIDAATDVSQFSRRVYVTGWAFRCGSNGMGQPQWDPKPYDVYVVIDGVPYHSYNVGTWLTLARPDVISAFGNFCATEGGMPSLPGIQIDADMIVHTPGYHAVKLRMVRPDGMAFESNTVTVLRYNAP